MTKELTALDLADSQLQGFKHALRENNIISLISAMGLQKEEWEQWKREYNTWILSESDFEEIDNYFKHKIEKL